MSDLCEKHLARGAVLVCMRASTCPMCVHEAKVRECQALTTQTHDAKQALGKLLEYPYYKDDQLNYPGTTEQDGVQVEGMTLDKLVTEVLSLHAREQAHMEAQDAVALEAASVLEKEERGWCYDIGRLRKAIDDLARFKKRMAFPKRRADVLLGGKRPVAGQKGNKVHRKPLEAV